MVVSIKELLDNVALQNGHANWDLAMHRLDSKSLHLLYIEAIKKASGRAFNKGWKERARLVSYPKVKLELLKTKEYDYVQQTLISQL